MDINHTTNNLTAHLAVLGHDGMPIAWLTADRCPLYLLVGDPVHRPGQPTMRPVMALDHDEFDTVEALDEFLVAEVGDIRWLDATTVEADYVVTRYISLVD